jgi:hypothetical protein
MSGRAMAIKRALSRLLYAADGVHPNRETRTRRRAYARLVSAWNNWGLEI